MAIAFRAAGTAFEPTVVGTTADLSTPAGVASGDFLLAVIHTVNTTDTFTPPSGEGWTAIAGTPLNSNNAIIAHAFYKIADASEPSTHTFTLTPGATALAIMGRMYAYSGVDNTNPLDVVPTTVTSTSSTTINIPAITPVNPGSWVVRSAGVNNVATAGGTVTAPASHTDRGSFTTGGAIGKRPGEVSDKAWSGSGAEAATTATASIAGANLGISIALRPAGLTTVVGAILSGVTFALRHAGEGPYQSSGGNYYFFGRDSTNTGNVEPHKASDPMSAFTAQTAKTMSSASSTAIEAMACYPVGQVIHVVTQIATGAVYYNSYTMDTDTWSLTTSETAVAAASFAPSAGVTFVSLAVRSGGEIVVGYCAGQTAMSSTFHMVRGVRRTGVATWTALSSNIDLGGSVSYSNPAAVLGASDRVHFFFFDITAGNLYQRTLSAANALETITRGTSQFSGTFATIVAYGTGFRSGSTVAVPFYGTSTSPQRESVVSLTSADAPTPSAASVGNITPGTTNNQPRLALADDSGTLHFLHVASADSDLYRQSDGGTGTWGAAASELAGTINDITPNVYIRSGKKLAMVLDDGGTIKYAEITLPAAYAPRRQFVGRAALVRSNRY